ncbi:MAG: glycosyltransferase family 4 protein [Thermoplasmata archaeon]
MRRSNRNYDFTFILPGFSFAPPGGYLVVFELREYLLSQGYSVLLIFLKDINRGLYKITRDKQLLEELKKESLKRKIYEILNSKYLIRFLIFLLKKKNKLIEKIIPHVRYEFLEELNFKDPSYIISSDIPQIKTERLIATAWQTSYFVASFKDARLRYYLVQHNEDDPSFSKKLSKLANKSYDLPLKKIVINRKMLERFSNEKPLKITVTSHIKGKIIIAPEKRDGNLVLIQLRSGEDKGGDIGIKAAEIIKNMRPEVKFISFGTYNKKIPIYIEHHGYVSDSEYIKLFNIASIFIMPSLVEGFSTPVLEAMSCGCVPVATACGGPEEMINEGINGYLVPIMDPEAIAKKVIELIDHPDKRIEMAYKGIETSKNYSLEKMGAEFINAIKKYEESVINVIT